MATNTPLTIDMITKRGLATLHDELIFPGMINRQYDNSFAVSGAKIGSDLRIRKPAQYTTGTGKVATAQNSVEQEITLKINQQRHVMLEFGSAEMTLSIDDYEDRFLRPAMEQLASDMEQDVYSVVADVGNTIVQPTSLTLKDALLAGAKMTAGTTSMSDRYLITNPFDMVDIVDSLKSVFQDSTEIASQYKKGIMGVSAGFDWYQSNRLPLITIGADVAGAVNGNPAEGFTSLAVTGFGANQVIQAGTTFTIAGVNAVQVETKADLGVSYQFSVLESVTLDGTGAGTLTINPVFATGARKNVTALPTDLAVITLSGSANTTYRQSIAFQRDAFTMATADLVLPSGGAKGSRSLQDGISMRINKDWDIKNDNDICRADILYGYKCLRPEYATKIWIPNV